MAVVVLVNFCVAFNLQLSSWPVIIAGKKKLKLSKDRSEVGAGLRKNFGAKTTF